MEQVNHIVQALSDEEKDVWAKQVRAVHLTGSNYTCNPPVTTTDIDVLILTMHFDNLSVALVRNGWTYDGRNYREEGAAFGSFRKDNINFIVTDEDVFYDKMVVATELAKRFNLLDKEDRIVLFSGVVDGELPTKETLTKALAKPVSSKQKLYRVTDELNSVPVSDVWRNPVPAAINPTSYTDNIPRSYTRQDVDALMQIATYQAADGYYTERLEEPNW